VGRNPSIDIGSNGTGPGELFQILVKSLPISLTKSHALLVLYKLSLLKTVVELAYFEWILPLLYDAELNTPKYKMYRCSNLDTLLFFTLAGYSFVFVFQ